jgi:branched-chain amino acid transport system substrate-binding protein
MIADNAGYSRSVDAEGRRKVRFRASSIAPSFAIGVAGSPTFPDQRDLQEEERRRRLDDTAARQMQGFFVLVDAIDRAGSTEPCQDPGGAEGHRPQARSIDHGLQGREVRRQGPERAGLPAVIQLQDGENYVPVWPKQCQDGAVFPYKGW